jgi:hypothetical protein
MLFNDEMREREHTQRPSQIVDYFTIEMHPFFSFSYAQTRKERMAKKRKGKEKKALACFTSREW